MRTLIRNGRIVTAVDDYNADILVEDGKVAMIARTIAKSTSAIHGQTTEHRNVASILRERFQRT